MRSHKDYLEFTRIHRIQEGPWDLLESTRSPQGLTRSPQELTRSQRLWECNYSKNTSGHCDTGSSLTFLILCPVPHLNAFAGDIRLTRIWRNTISREASSGLGRLRRSSTTMQVIFYLFFWVQAILIMILECIVRTYDDCKSFFFFCFSGVQSSHVWTIASLFFFFLGVQSFARTNDCKSFFVFLFWSAIVACTNDCKHMKVWGMDRWSWSYAPHKTL